MAHAQMVRFCLFCPNFCCDTAIGQFRRCWYGHKWSHPCRYPRPGSQSGWFSRKYRYLCRQWTFIPLDHGWRSSKPKSRRFFSHRMDRPASPRPNILLSRNWWIHLDLDSSRSSDLRLLPRSGGQRHDGKYHQRFHQGFHRPSFHNQRSWYSNHGQPPVPLPKPVQPVMWNGFQPAAGRACRFGSIWYQGKTDQKSGAGQHGSRHFPNSVGWDQPARSAPISGNVFFRS